MQDPALSDEEATVIRDACHQWAEFALEAYLNTRDEPRSIDQALPVANDPIGAPPATRPACHSELTCGTMVPTEGSIATMDELKKKYFIEQELGIDSQFGRILSLIDFGNVNHWFEDDRQDADSRPLEEGEKLRINLQGLKDFAALFSVDTRFYYGHDAQSPNPLAFITAAKHIFGKSRVFTKPMQKVRHHLTADEVPTNKRSTFVDNEGVYVRIPKCNFDVEITIDAIRLMNNYETLALFSSDADFVSLARFLKKHDKTIILIKGGNITTMLRQEVTKVINAQDIKRHIAEKQRPGTRPGLANR
jgi:predicted nuclease of predicted toxin-antitoxin system